MKPQTEQTYRERILKVLVYIQEHLDEATDLEELAAVACFSPYHSHRTFRGMVGESVKEHIRRLRLERAAYGLKRTNRPITRIALDAGYETHESFTRAFGTMFGRSPSEFRREHREVPAPQTRSGVHYVADGTLENFKPVSTGGPTMDVRIENVAPMRVAFIRHTGPYDQVGTTWGQLMAWAGQHGLSGPQSKMLGLCHDDPEVTPPDKIRYDACVVVGDGVQPEGEVGVQEIAGGEYAVTTHEGPYEKLGETYARLCGEWLSQSGRELRSAPGFEVYRNSPQQTPPEQLLTDIHMPLASKM
jgi:AraC family transcriptional regulator